MVMENIALSDFQSKPCYEDALCALVVTQDDENDADLYPSGWAEVK